MSFAPGWRDGFGALSVAMALAAAAIYAWQSLRGDIRPHPLSWSVFGVLSAVGCWVQRDQGARAGSWVLYVMTVICFLLAGLGVARGERQFSRPEWAFLAGSLLVFLLYLVTRTANVAAVLITVLDALGFGPTFVRGWTRPDRDSVASFSLNGAKFVPSLLAMDPISFATCLYPVTLIVLNLAVAVVLLHRRHAGRASTT